MEKPRVKAFTLNHFRAWTSKLVLDTGKKWVLEPFQAAFVEDLFSGVPECWLIVPEGNAKTTLAAGIALYYCQFKLSASVPVAAASREQAEILYQQAAGFVFRSPSIESKFKCLEGYRRIRCDGMGSRIQVFAADDRTGDGVIPDLPIAEELHRQRDLKLYRIWRGKIQKKNGQIVAISTAGEPGSEFEELRTKIRLSGTMTRQGGFLRSASPNIVLHEWAVPDNADVEDMEVVKAANPLQAMTVEALQKKFDSPTMNLTHWRRFVCNLPTRAENAAIQEAEWHAARSQEEIPPGVPVYVGLDLAFKWDTTAMVPLWLRDDHFRLFGPATILVPPRDGNSLDTYAIERALIQIHERNPIHTLVLDPSVGGEQLGTWAEQELKCRAVAHGQKNPEAVHDYTCFMEALRNGWLKHAGDRGLSEHVLNAIARVLPDGSARFERPSQSRNASEQSRRVIDALTAAAMVHAVAVEAVEPVFAGVAFG